MDIETWAHEQKDVKSIEEQTTMRQEIAEMVLDGADILDNMTAAVAIVAEELPTVVSETHQVIRDESVVEKVVEANMETVPATEKQVSRQTAADTSRSNDDTNTVFICSHLFLIRRH